MKKVLLVEDDLRIQQILKESFNNNGYLVESYSRLDEAIHQVELHHDFDLIVLDRLLHGQDSKALIPFFKHKCKNAYVIIISAINTPEEKSNLIDLGADDYLGKPISTKELISRSNALFRRNQLDTTNFFVLGNTLIDFIKRTITVDSKIESLSPKEFMLFRALIQEPGRSYNRIELYELAWDGNAAAETNVVEATVTNLRRKLEGCGSNLQLKNMRNAGYWIET